MFETLGKFAYQKRKWTLILGALLVLVLGGFGSMAIPKLQNGGYTVAGSQSAKAVNFLEEKFGAKDPIAVLLIQLNSNSSTTSLQSTSITTAENNLESSIKSVSNVGKIVSYWNTGFAPVLISPNNKIGLVYIYSTSDEDRKSTRLNSSHIPLSRMPSSA